MTTISGSTSALSSLTSLYASETAPNAGSSASGTLTSDQVKSLVGIVEGSAGSSSNGISALLGQSTTNSTDLNSIIDAIQAQTESTASTVTTPNGTGATATTTSAATEQQKAATLMQSVYQTQQSNLFTLLG